MLKLGLIQLAVGLRELSAYFSGFFLVVMSSLLGFGNKQLGEGARNLFVFNKEGGPVGPVTGVPVLSVKTLAMVKSFISDVENLVHHLSAQFSALFFLKLLFIVFEFGSALHHLVDTALASIAHLLNKLFLFDDSGLGVELASALVLLFPELPIFLNNSFALGGAPGFIIKFLLLTRLAFHLFKNDALAGLTVEFSEKVLLGGDESAATLDPLLLVILVEGLLSA